MPFRCVVYGCSNVPDSSKGIALHKIPFEDDSRPEAKKRRRKWINFVNNKRAKWTPTRNSRICSVHFKPEDFSTRFPVLTDSAVSFLPRLTVDEVGVIAVPSIQSVNIEASTSSVIPASRLARDRRKVNVIFISLLVLYRDDPKCTEYDYQYLCCSP